MSKYSDDWTDFLDFLGIYTRYKRGSVYNLDKAKIEYHNNVEFRFFDDERIELKCLYIP